MSIWKWEKKDKVIWILMNAAKTSSKDWWWCLKSWNTQIWRRYWRQKSENSQMWRWCVVLITITDRGVLLLRSRSSDRGILLNLQLLPAPKPQHFLNNRSTRTFFTRQTSGNESDHLYQCLAGGHWSMGEGDEVFRVFSIQLTSSSFPSGHPSPSDSSPWDSPPKVILCLQRLLWFRSHLLTLIYDCTIINGFTTYNTGIQFTEWRFRRCHHSETTMAAQPFEVPLTLPFEVPGDKMTDQNFQV